MASNMERETQQAGPSSPKTNGRRLGGLDREQLHALLRQMLLGRRFEEKAAESYALGKIGGFCHLYIGQEAVAVGAASVLREDDYLVTAYRDHVHALVKGLTPREVMAELYGRVAGCSRGKGGSMHMFSKEHRFMGGWGIVGAQIPLATGIGWSIRYREEDRVVLCFFGEAAVNQGAFHESLNMAALWKLPVVFIVENNRYGMGTAWERASSLYDIAQKACAYDMPSLVADGMDLLDMRDQVQEAVERARQDGTPTLIEAKCERFMGHSMSDPVAGVYRTREDLEEAKQHDPIHRFISTLKEEELLTDDELEAMDQEVRAEVDEATDFAESAPEPEPDQLYADVYAETPEHGRLFFGRAAP